MATGCANRSGKDRSGRMGETSIAYGTTYNDVLHIGMAIGLTSVEMERVDVYSEQKLSGPSPLDRLTFNDRLQVSGSGGFWSFGLILQPENAPIRLGWSYRSSSVFSIDDFYSVDAVSDFSDGTGFEWNSPSYIQYRIRTPAHAAARVQLDDGQGGPVDAGLRAVRFPDGHVHLQRPLPGGRRPHPIRPRLRLCRGTAVPGRPGIPRGRRVALPDGRRMAVTGRADPETDFNGAIDGTYVEDGSGIVHWALGGEYRAEEWYAGATYRHTSTDAGRQFAHSAPRSPEGARDWAC